MWRNCDFIVMAAIGCKLSGFVWQQALNNTHLPRMVPNEDSEMADNIVLCWARQKGEVPDLGSPVGFPLVFGRHPFRAT